MMYVLSDLICLVLGETKLNQLMRFWVVGRQVFCFWES